MLNRSLIEAHRDSLYESAAGYPHLVRRIDLSICETSCFYASRGITVIKHEVVPKPFLKPFLEGDTAGKPV